MGETIAQETHAISISGIFHKGLGGKGGAQHHVFSNTSHVSGLLNKNAAGRPVS